MHQNHFISIEPAFCWVTFPQTGKQRFIQYNTRGGRQRAACGARGGRQRAACGARGGRQRAACGARGVVTTLRVRDSISAASSSSEFHSMAACTHPPSFLPSLHPCYLPSILPGQLLHIEEDVVRSNKMREGGLSGVPLSLLLWKQCCPECRRQAKGTPRSRNGRNPPIGRKGARKDGICPQRTLLARRSPWRTLQAQAGERKCRGA